MAKRMLLTLLCSLLAGIAFSQTMLQPADMKYDLSVLRSAWENVHGGLYRYNTPEEIDSHFKALEAKTDQPLPLRDFFLLVSHLNAKLHCGHTFVSYYNNKKSLKAELYSPYFLPVMFRIIEGKIIVTHNLTDQPQLAPGVEITAINNIPGKTILDSLLTVSKADGSNGLNKQLDNLNIYKRDISTSHYCLFDIYFPLFFKPNLNEESYQLTVKTGGKTSTFVVKGLSKEERLNTYTQRYGAVPKNEESWFVKDLGNSTMLFRLGDFATYNWKFDFNHYLDSVFTMLKDQGTQNLIVDIRENEGGADEARDAVLAYLTDRNIGCANPVRRLYRYTSIPDSLKPHLDTWDEDFKANKKGYHRTVDGYFESDNASLDCDTILPNPNHFTGKVFLITDATNSSATFIMADCVKRNRLGTIVGETTGGTQQGITGGQIFFFYMPRTKVEMDIPLIWQRPTTDRPDEGIRPDIEVRTTQKDIAKQRDPQLEYILKKLIR
jgi:hypothetical protein